MAVFHHSHDAVMMIKQLDLTIRLLQFSEKAAPGLLFFSAELGPLVQLSSERNHFRQYPGNVRCLNYGHLSDFLPSSSSLNATFFPCSI